MLEIIMVHIHLHVMLRCTASHIYIYTNLHINHKHTIQHLPKTNTDSSKYTVHDVHLANPTKGSIYKTTTG